MENGVLASAVTSGSTGSPSVAWIKQPQKLVGYVELNTGTGGQPYFSPLVGSGNYLVVYYAGPFWKADTPVLAPTPAEMVTEIQSRLSLTVTDLSLVMRVRRPTIYSWVRGETSPRKQALKRLSVVHRIAKDWKKLESTALGRRLRQVFEDGESVLSILRRKDASPEEMSPRLRLLAGTASQWLGVRERLSRRGITTPSGRVGEEHISFITGRRIEEE